MTSARAGGVLALVTMLTAPIARADDACGTARPWVLLQTSAFEGAARAQFATQLRAALRARDLDVCEGEDAQRPPPIAVVEATGAGTEAVGITVEVRDAITAKRMAREVPLGTIPEDGRPLTVALAADELLRASWAELAIRDAPPPARPVPIEVERIATPEPLPRAQPGAPRVDLGAGAAAEHHGGGLDQWGADVLLRYWPWPRVGVDARTGLRSAIPRSAPDGEVHASAFVAALGPTLALVPREQRAGLDLALRADLTRVAFVADPRAGGAQREEAGLAFHLAGAVRGWVRVVPALSAALEIGLGAPLRSVRADDGDRAVLGLSGARVSAGLAITGSL